MKPKTGRHKDKQMHFNSFNPFLLAIPIFRKENVKTIKEIVTNAIPVNINIISPIPPLAIRKLSKSPPFLIKYLFQKNGLAKKNNWFIIPESSICLDKWIEESPIIHIKKDIAEKYQAILKKRIIQRLIFFLSISVLSPQRGK